MHKKLKEAIMEIIFDDESKHILTEQEAKEWVHHMRPIGEKWRVDETTSHLPPNVDKYEWYAVMNMMYNDYKDAVPESVDHFKKLSIAWFDDVDAPECKTYRYYEMIKEG